MSEAGELITEDWLKLVGFKWHEFERQNAKHWLLWLGGGLRQKPSLTDYEDLGIELAPGFETPSGSVGCAATLPAAIIASYTSATSPRAATLSAWSRRSPGGRGRRITISMARSDRRKRLTAFDRSASVWIVACSPLNRSGPISKRMTAAAVPCRST